MNNLCNFQIFMFLNLALCMTREIAGNKPSLVYSQESGLSGLNQIQNILQNNCHAEDTVNVSNLVASLPYEVKHNALF